MSTWQARRGQGRLGAAWRGLARRGLGLAWQGMAGLG